MNRTIMPKLTNKPTLRQLRAFVALAREGSFVATARQLHTTPSALSSCIKQLEHALALRLFDRTTRHVALTPGGAEFLPDANRVLQGLDDSVERARALGRGLSGSLRLAAIPSVMHVLVLPALQRLMARLPQLRVSLVESRGAALSEMVAQGSVDFGIAGMLQPVPGVDARHLFTDVLGLLAPAGHALWQVERLDWAALEGQRFAALAGDSVTAGLLRRARRAPAALFDPQFEANSNESLAGLLHAGQAVSVLSAMSSAHPAFRELRFRALEGPMLLRSMCLQTRSHRSLQPAAQALLDELQTGLEALSRSRAGRRVDRVASPIAIDRPGTPAPRSRRASRAGA
jgi:LysR family carnitine catabolism transcriptional activator